MKAQTGYEICIQIASEHAIHKFKNTSFHYSANWDRLLAHAVITLNLRCSSCLHQYLSAHASLFGNYD